MTVATRFDSWQARDLEPGPPFDRLSPNLAELAEFILKRWGGARIGGYNVRPIRGGNSWSSHAYGAAIDWRYTDPGPGRSVMLAEVLPLLIDWSHELGVQAVHDYVAGRIWRAGRGWAPASGDGFGESWAQWLHIETHRSRWADTSPIAARLGLVNLPPFDPARLAWSLWPLNPRKPRLALHTPRIEGDAVRYGQGVLIGLGFTPGPLDGVYGPRTAAAVRAFQTAERLTVDGIVGTRETWPAIDRHAVRIAA